MFSMQPVAAMADKMALAIAMLMGRKRMGAYGRTTKIEREPPIQAEVWHMNARYWRRARQPGQIGRPAFTYRGARRNALKNRRNSEVA